MRTRSIIQALLVTSCVVSTAFAVNVQKSKQKTATTTSTTSQAAQTPLPRGAKMQEGQSQSDKAAKVFAEIMGTPDKGIPSDLLNKAECVAVFPTVVKAGFIVGAK